MWLYRSVCEEMDQEMQTKLQLTFLYSTFRKASYTSLSVDWVHVWRVWSVWLSWQPHSGFLPGDIREFLSVSDYLPTPPPPPQRHIYQLSETPDEPCTPKYSWINKNNRMTTRSTETELKKTTGVSVLLWSWACFRLFGWIQEVWLFPSDLPPPIYKHSFSLKHKSQFLSSQPFRSRLSKFSS